MHSLRPSSESSLYCFQGVVISFSRYGSCMNKRINNQVWRARRVGRRWNRHINPLGYLEVSLDSDSELQASISIEAKILPLTEGLGHTSELISGQGSTSQHKSLDIPIHTPLESQGTVSFGESIVG